MGYLGGNKVPEALEGGYITKMKLKFEKMIIGNLDTFE